jgi:hypothetical protein
MFFSLDTIEHGILRKTNLWLALVIKESFLC